MRITVWCVLFAFVCTLCTLGGCSAIIGTTVYPSVVDDARKACEGFGGLDRLAVFEASRPDAKDPTQPYRAVCKDGTVIDRVAKKYPKET